MAEIVKWNERNSNSGEISLEAGSEREEMMLAEIAELRAAAAASSTSKPRVITSMRSAINLISGIYEHETMPPEVTTIVADLRAIMERESGNFISEKDAVQLVDTAELRRLVSDYRYTCELVRGHAVPQWRNLVLHISKISFPSIS